MKHADPTPRDLAAMQAEAKREAVRSCIDLVARMKSRFGEVHTLVPMTADDACDLIIEELELCESGATRADAEETA